MDKYSRRTFLRNSSLAVAGMALPTQAFLRTFTPSSDYLFMTIAEVSELIRQQKVSPVELVEACLNRIKQLDPKLNAFTSLTANIALLEARQATAEINNGKWKGPLHGIPIAIKDNIDTLGFTTTAASKVLQGQPPAAADAPLVISLKRTGAIILGKLNMHEFAYGTTSAISSFGPVHNPWNTDYITGGSSGGAAAAVAAGFCFAAIGTDTGASIRVPAALCGVTGLKPTYGLVPTAGIIPLVRSFDHAGPICRSVADAAILLNALTNRSGYNYQSSKKPTIGVIHKPKGTDEVNNVFTASVDVFRQNGHEIRYIDLPPISDPSMWIVIDSEVAAYHKTLISDSRLYNPATLQIVSKAFRDIKREEYLQAKKEMQLARTTISESLFHDIDVLILPTTIAPPSTIAEVERAADPFAVAYDYTVPFNYWGLPAISIPGGFTDKGLPLGLQIVGPRYNENTILNAAYTFQQLTDWHQKHPPIL
jgi:aspartyl-tRNA(Asn)/glutamyl-tRNA(Gln) amidotransferase subunit A